LIGQILSYKTLFFDIVIIISSALSPAMNKSLHATLVKICTSRGGPLFCSLYDGAIARTPRLITGDDAIQPRIGSIGPDNLAYGVFMFLCEHSLDPPGTNFAIFQRWHHHFQHIEADIQLRTQFPSHNPPICMDELIETLFISRCDSCA
jgi:hypothetical protein